MGIDKDSIQLVKCKRSNALYQIIRDRHYVPNNGAVGQQLHYLIYYKSNCVGIISGGSAAYAVKCRDDYFGISKENRNVALNGIIDNTVFRLEDNTPNLATCVLRKWREQVANDWERKYGVKVAGFETFVIENHRRKGTIYKADNWQFVGRTLGSTKKHNHGIREKAIRNETVEKIVFCKRVKGVTLPEEYKAVWNKPNQCRGQVTISEFLERIG